LDSYSITASARSMMDAGTWHKTAQLVCCPTRTSRELTTST
jgi:hypothetical protein